MRKMHHFFYEVWFAGSDIAALDRDAINHTVSEWSGGETDRCLLVLDNEVPIVQGYVAASDCAGAMGHAVDVAVDLYHHRLNRHAGSVTLVVNSAEEHLDFINSGLLPEYQMSAINLATVLEVSAAAIMRTRHVKEADLYRSTPPVMGNE